jgi:hypothetical protein
MGAAEREPDDAIRNCCWRPHRQDGFVIVGLRGPERHTSDRVESL